MSPSRAHLSLLRGPVTCGDEHIRYTLLIHFSHQDQGQGGLGASAVGGLDAHRYLSVGGMSRWQAVAGGWGASRLRGKALGPIRGSAVIMALQAYI